MLFRLPEQSAAEFDAGHCYFVFSRRKVSYRRVACCNPAKRTGRCESACREPPRAAMHRAARLDARSAKPDDNPALQAHAVQNGRCHGVQSIFGRHKSLQSRLQSVSVLALGRMLFMRRGPFLASGRLRGLRRLWPAARKSASTVAGCVSRLRSEACKAQLSDHPGTSECG